MTESAASWLRTQGLVVKREFVTPWGHCDLVGLSFRRVSVKHRLRLRQRDAVNSLTRAAILRRIPDAETGKSVRLSTLTKEFSAFLSEDALTSNIEQLVAQNFVRYNRTNHLQKLNGWFPLHKRLVAIELKLTRVDEVMCQARSNLAFSQESYVGLPRNVALNVFSKREKWASFFDQGVGLLSVGPTDSQVLVRSRPRTECDKTLQFYCVEKFWRSYPKDN